MLANLSNLAILAKSVFFGQVGKGGGVFFRVQVDGLLHCWFCLGWNLLWLRAES